MRTGGDHVGDSACGVAGKLTFTMDGFRPYWPADSPCPGAKGVGFSGDLSTSSTIRIYATGATRVTCGALGDHDFTYTFDAYRYE